MPKVRVDFTDQVNFDPIESGVYLVQIDVCEESVSKKGEAMLVWDLSVVGGPNEGHKLRTWTMLEGKGTSGLEQFWTAVTGEKPPTIEVDGRKVFDFDYEDLYGKTLRVAVLKKDHPEKAGQKINQVDDYMAA